MTKYLPLETEPVDSEFWDSGEVESVEAVLAMLRGRGYTFTFETSGENSGYDINIEVRDGKTLVHRVPDRTWLIIHKNNAVETMSSTQFFKTYRAA